MRCSRAWHIFAYRESGCQVKTQPCEVLNQRCVVYTYEDYPAIVCADIVRLRRRLDKAELPARKTDDNLIVGTWNIRRLG